MDDPSRPSVPYVATGEVHLRLQFSNADELSASGTGVSVKHAGDVRYVEQFSC